MPTIFSNAYVRAFIASTFFAVGLLLRLSQKEQIVWTSRRTALLGSLMAVAFVISTALTGTFSSRAQKPWSWLKVFVLCFGCWLAVLVVAALMMEIILGASNR